MCFITNATTFPQDRCKWYAAFAVAEGEDVDSEGQVEAAERAIDHARDFLKKIDDACAEWAEEVEKARQEEEAEEMRREEAAREENARFDAAQAEAFRKSAAAAAEAETATAASALAARTPTPEERRRSEEVRRQQDASARDAGDVEVEEVDADGYRYARLGFLETCTRRGGRTLVDGKVSRFNKGVKILTYGFQDKVLVLRDPVCERCASAEVRCIGVTETSCDRCTRQKRSCNALGGKSLKRGRRRGRAGGKGPSRDRVG